MVTKNISNMIWRIYILNRNVGGPASATVDPSRRGRELQSKQPHRTEQKSLFTSVQCASQVRTSPIVSHNLVRIVYFWKHVEATELWWTRRVGVLSQGKQLVTVDGGSRGSNVQCKDCRWLGLSATRAGTVCSSRMASMAPSDSTTESTERHKSDLYTRPGWVDADIALGQLDQVTTTQLSSNIHVVNTTSIFHFNFTRKA